MISRAIVRRQSKVPALRRDHFIIPVAGFILVISLMAGTEIVPWESLSVPIKEVKEFVLIARTPWVMALTDISRAIRDLNTKTANLGAVAMVYFKEADSYVGRLGSSSIRVEKRKFERRHGLPGTKTSFSKNLSLAEVEMNETLAHIRVGVLYQMDKLTDIFTKARVSSLTYGKNVLLDARVGTTVFKKQSQLIIADASTGVGNASEYLSGGLTFLGQWSKDIWSLVAGRIRLALSSVGELLSEWRKNWIAFLGGDSEIVTEVTPSTIITETDPELVKKIVREELARLQLEKGGNFPNQGIVVIPATGDRTQDDLLKREISNSFSDEVNIRFDNTGRTGVITPIFRSTLGADYLFVLTPLKK